MRGGVSLAFEEFLEISIPAFHDVIFPGFSVFAFQLEIQDLIFQNQNPGVSLKSVSRYAPEEPKKWAKK
jgi:hypothetical protein